MDVQEFAIIIQAAAVVVAVCGVVVALFIAARDRRIANAQAEQDRSTARELARADQKAARDLAERQYRLQLLVRLSVNVSAPGHTNRRQVRELSAERAALLHALGREGLELTWHTYVGPTVEQSAINAANTNLENYKRCKAEVAIELARYASQPG